MLLEWSKSSNLSSLTADALQEIIRIAEKDDGVKISSWTLTKIDGKGDHYSSTMYKLKIYVKLDTDGKNTCSRDLIVKTLPETGALGDVVEKSSAFPTEVRMYRDTLPQMLAILNEKVPGKFYNFGATYYFGRDVKPYILFLEDLGPKGFRMAERRRGLDIDHCLLVMRNLGRFHAVSTGLHHSCVENYSTSVFIEPVGEELMDSFAKATLTNLAAVVEKWPENGSALAERITKRAETLMRDVREMINHEPDSFRVLNHGDLWVNNMLFRYSDVDNVVEEVKFIDYQLSIYGSPAIDLQYFIHTSPRDEIRDQYSEKLLREYHTSLCETLDVIGCDQKKISFAELMELYEKKALYGFFAAMTILPVLLADPKDSYDFESESQSEGVVQSQLNRLTGKEFTKVLKRLLPIYLEKNII